MKDLEARQAPLEYWFLKLHAGDLAFLVDFIVRRAAATAKVNIVPSAAITKGLRGEEITEFGLLKEASIYLVIL